MADVITLNEIDEIKNLLTGSIAVIGKTTDTGGTATSGTVMAKLNTLLSNNSTLVSANQNHGNIAYTTAGTYTWVCPEGVGEVIVFGSGGTGGGGGGSGGVEETYDDYGVGGSGGGGGAGGAGGATKLVRYSLGMVVLAAELDLEPENLVKVELCLMFRLVIIFT